MLVLLTACVQKNEKQDNTTAQQSAVVEQTPSTQQQQYVLPAILVRSYKVKLEQPTICEQDTDLNEVYCTSAEVIGVKSNMLWLDRHIDQEIRQDFAPFLQVASEQQQQRNKDLPTHASGSWFKNVIYRFNGQFGAYVQFSKVAREYTGGAHDMVVYTNYIFDVKNKKPVTLTDIVIDGQLPALKDALWQVYVDWCNNNELQPLVSKNDFNVSKNFYINQFGGITFDYQPYDLAAFAYGPVSLQLDDTKHLIKDSFVSAIPN